MATTRFPNNVTVEGDLTITGSLLPLLPRASLVQADVQAYDLPTTDWRVWDAYQTPLGTAAADDLGITTGTFSTGLPYITSGDSKATATTRYARILFTLPPEYVAGETVQLRFAAGMLTTISDTSATVDAECYLSARTTLITGSDLVTTAATTINSLTFTEKVFAITSTSLVPGSVLDIRVKIAITDAATGTAVIGAIAHAELQCDIKG